MSDLAQQVRLFLESDRQWTRALRLQHAEYHLNNTATSEEELAFWKAVIEALS